MAIVPYVQPDQPKVEFVSLVCMEMPEARFNDLVQCNLPAGSQHASILLDPIFVSVCETRSITAVSWAADLPVPVAVSVQDDTLLVRLAKPLSAPMKLTVQVSGIRKYVTGRFVRFTEDEMRRNEAFWNSWRQTPTDNADPRPT